MPLHKLSARRQNVRPYCIANSLTNCFTMWATAELTAQTHSHKGIGMQKKTEWRKGMEVTETRVGQDAVICLGEEAIFVKFQNVLVSRDLWPGPWTWAQPGCMAFACSPGDHRVQVWSPRSSHLSGKSDLRTDRRTDGRRTLCDRITKGWAKTSKDIIKRQESCAIAKMTAQCALYMGALNIFGTPWLYAHGYYPQHFSWAFVPINPVNVPKKLKSVALPVPEMIVGT